MITANQVKKKTPERFWSKIEFAKPDECWEWQASTDRFGYGWFSSTERGRSMTTRAHKFLSRLFFKGNQNVLHECDNPKCCNPNHFILSSQKENIADKVLKNRQAKGSRIGTSKLSEDDVAIVKFRLNMGEQKASIARSFNVSRTMIGYISKGLFWKHVQSA